MDAVGQELDEVVSDAELAATTEKRIATRNARTTRTPQSSRISPSAGMSSRASRIPAARAWARRSARETSP